MSSEKYKDKTDEEIILALKDDEDSAAVDYIMNKYKNLVPTERILFRRG